MEADDVSVSVQMKSWVDAGFMLPGWRVSITLWKAAS